MSSAISVDGLPWAEAEDAGNFSGGGEHIDLAAEKLFRHNIISKNKSTVTAQRYLQPVAAPTHLPRHLKPPQERLLNTSAVQDTVIRGTIDWRVTSTSSQFLSMAVDLLFTIGFALYCSTSFMAEHLILATAVASFIYMVLGAKFGITIGRLLTGHQLIGEVKTVITWRMALKRTIFSVFSLLPFGAGYFWPIVDAKGRTWHDIWVGTVSVDSKNDAS